MVLDIWIYLQIHYYRFKFNHNIVSVVSITHPCHIKCFCLLPAVKFVCQLFAVFFSVILIWVYNLWFGYLTAFYHLTKFNFLVRFQSCTHRQIIGSFWKFWNCWGYFSCSAWQMSVSKRIYRNDLVCPIVLHANPSWAGRVFSHLHPMTFLSFNLIS